MQAYSAGFAHIYNLRWTGFARQAAALIQDFYKDAYAGPSAGQVLDVCCGSGQFAAHFLAKGYRVVGIDLSEPMLACARQNAQGYLENGQAAFIRADATCFAFKNRFGLVVSTYDSLNHLEDEQALKKCFECVYDVSDGYFIFDLNTRAGLRHSSGIQIDDTDEMLLHCASSLRRPGRQGLVADNRVFENPERVLRTIRPDCLQHHIRHPAGAGHAGGYRLAENSLRKHVRSGDTPCRA